MTTERVSECRECPDCVERCVHWEGKALMLARRDLFSSAALAHHTGPSFSVAIATTPASFSCPLCEARGWREEEVTLCYDGDDYAAALAAFRDAEARLLSGDGG